MYVGEDWDDLDPTEAREILSIEFTRDVETGETISSAIVTASIAKTLSGASPDALPQSRVIGVATMSSEIDPVTGQTRLFVNFPVGGAIAGNKYLFNVVATLSSGRTPARFSHIWCKTPS